MTRIAPATRPAAVRHTASPTAAALPHVAPAPVGRTSVILDLVELSTTTGDAPSDDSPGTYSHRAGRRPRVTPQNAHQWARLVDLTA